MHVLFSACSLRDNNVTTSKPTWKLKHANSILESFEFFCEISSKSIHMFFELYRFKVGSFFRHSGYTSVVHIVSCVCDIDTWPGAGVRPFQHPLSAVLTPSDVCHSDDTQIHQPVNAAVSALPVSRYAHCRAALALLGRLRYAVCRLISPTVPVNIPKAFLSTMAGVWCIHLRHHPLTPTVDILGQL